MRTVNRWRSVIVLLLCQAVLGCATQAKVNKHNEANTKSLAEAAFNYGQFAKAEEQYLKLSALSPENLSYKTMVARSQYSQDKKQSAMSKLEHVCRAEGDQSAEACVYLGRYLLNDNQVNKAIATYQQGITQAQDSQLQAQLYNGLGIALLEQDQTQAQQMIQQAMALAPDNPFYRSNLAISYLHDNQLVKANEIFDPLLSYKQLPQQVELNFALLLLANNQQDQARALLSRHLPASEVERDLTLLNQRLSHMRAE